MIEPKDRCTGHANKNAEFGRKTPFLDRMGGEVGRAAEEGGVAEGQNAGIAEQKVKGAGEEREAQHLHQEYRIEIEGREDQHEQCR